MTARQLAKLEAKAIKTGKSPRQIKQAPSTQTAKLLTLLVEFNDKANDDFTDVMVPKTVFEDRTCVPGTVQNGPLHNNIPNPATPAARGQQLDVGAGLLAGALQQDALQQEGHHRAGPHGPDRARTASRASTSPAAPCTTCTWRCPRARTRWTGRPARGSPCRTRRAGTRANRCFQDENGDWVAGREQSMNGHPDNPAGAGRLATDAIDALAAADPNFPWADYDIEDQGDRDGDGNVFEPDGVIDHLVLVHAGQGKSARRRRRGRLRRLGALLHGRRWLHRSRAPTSRSSNYIVQPEDAGVGVFAHEYGHDLGLPDLYDTVRQRRLRRRLLGPDGLGLALRRDLPGAADAHGHLGQVGARLGRPADHPTRVEPARRSSSARRRVPRSAPRTASRSTCRTR